ncbi:tetratricopeptide repeat protein [Terriglobus roseus]|uniref:Tol-pal system protein YbgF n=1 Tax=Terriglobus roseus TaxID=392734 RepID=A0A1H4IW01_9BACT|nr:tetratricopeptide repeat protein [Terriglobus roseus]SEB38301.1 tol-pal system protein YbgF [Terriglobus roseus]
MRRFFRLAPATLAIAAVLLSTPTPAFAVNKDMIQLQTQIQQLQDAVARLQQSNDERMGVMKDLVQQTTDSVNKMAGALDTLQKQMRVQSEATGKGLETVSGQMQSLNDSVDELKARLAKIDRAIADVQSAQQSMGARMDNGGSPAPAAAPMDSPPSASSGKTSKQAPPPSAGPSASALLPSNAELPTSSTAPPVDDLYRTAFSDYNGAKYSLASAEFTDVIKFYPDSNLAGNAYFYLGEIDYKAGRFASASKNYDKVIEQYPGNQKIPVSQLRKGESLLSMKQTEAGARELRSLIQRYPNSQEALAARTKLNALGITIVPRTR